MDDSEFLSDEETAVALSELHIGSLIQWQGEENVTLTNSGITYAWQLWKSHPPKERMALYLLLDAIAFIVKTEGGEHG